MASSNRHWPSMFRSNPACDVQQTQQPDMNNSSSSPSLFSSPGSGKPSLIFSGCGESTRSPEPKPRWNPRPEQIRILEGIFNSGMVNPPRDEIRRIRLQLQEYGQVGDANVFYWFQNRKSRAKNKLRAAGHLQPAGRAALACACASPSTPTAPAPVTPPRHLLAAPVAPTSSSSPSERPSGSSKSVKPTALTYSAAAAQGILPATAMDLISPTPSPALSACQLCYHSHPMPTPTAPVRQLTSPEPLLLQWPQSQYLPATELGGVLGSHAHMPAMHPAVSTGLLLGLFNEALGQEIIDMSCSSKELGQYLNTTCSTEPSIKTDVVSTVIREDEKARLGFLHYGFGVSTAAAAAAAAVATSAPLAAPVHAAVAAADDVSTAMLESAAPSNVATSAVLTDQLQGLLDVGLIGGTAPPTATVVALAQDAMMCTSTAQYSVPAMMHLDVKLFGEAAVLLRHTGEPVLVDESGVTVEPLQQGAVYYVLATN